MKTEVKENPVMETDDDVCCPRFEPTPWDKKTHTWKNKLFLKDSIPELFHIPLPGTYKRTVNRMWKKAEVAGAAPDLKDFLLLACDPSPFKSELFMTITKEIPGEENVRLSGTYISKVFDGPYNKVPRYVDEMNGYLASLGKSAKKYYFYFTTFPKCAEKYGHNFIVALAEVQAFDYERDFYGMPLKILRQITGTDLTEIFGITDTNAIEIISEVGLNMNKWPTEKHFTSWLNLSPNNKISGGKLLSSKVEKKKNRAGQIFKMAAFAV